MHLSHGSNSLNVTLSMLCCLFCRRLLVKATYLGKRKLKGWKGHENEKIDLRKSVWSKFGSLVKVS